MSSGNPIYDAKARYTLENEMSDIKEPPCKRCMHFKPRVLTDDKGQYAGYVLCVAPEMKPDFSCFTEPSLFDS